jgi:hypothetical protein
VGCVRGPRNRRHRARSRGAQIGVGIPPEWESRRVARWAARARRPRVARDRLVFTSFPGSPIVADV